MIDQKLDALLVAREERVVALLEEVRAEHDAEIARRHLVLVAARAHLVQKAQQRLENIRVGLRQCGERGPNARNAVGRPVDIFFIFIFEKRNRTNIVHCCSKIDLPSLDVGRLDNLFDRLAHVVRLTRTRKNVRKKSQPVHKFGESVDRSPQAAEAIRGTRV